MSEYVTHIRTSNGDRQIDYNALANKPTLSTLYNDAGYITNEAVQKNGLNGLGFKTSSTLSRVDINGNTYQGTYTSELSGGIIGGNYSNSNKTNTRSFVISNVGDYLQLAIGNSDTSGYKEGTYYLNATKPEIIYKSNDGKTAKFLTTDGDDSEAVMGLPPVYTTPSGWVSNMHFINRDTKKYIQPSEFYVMLSDVYNDAPDLRQFRKLAPTAGNEYFMNGCIRSPLDSTLILDSSKTHSISLMFTDVDNNLYYIAYMSNRSTFFCRTNTGVTHEANPPGWAWHERFYLNSGISAEINEIFVSGVALPFCSTSGIKLS